MTRAEVERQTRKIGEFKNVLIQEGHLTITAQAAALGLSRSTAWTILSANHKASGLSAYVIARMLKTPQLPSSVRQKIYEYVKEKVAGVYGHKRQQIHRFAAGLLRGDQSGLTSAPIRPRRLQATRSSSSSSAVSSEGHTPILVRYPLV